MTLETSASSQFSASEKLSASKASRAQASSSWSKPIATSAGPIVNAFSTPAACSHSDIASSASDCSMLLMAGAWQPLHRMLEQAAHALQLKLSLGFLAQRRLSSCSRFRFSRSCDAARLAAAARVVQFVHQTRQPSSPAKPASRDAAPLPGRPAAAAPYRPAQFCAPPGSKPAASRTPAP